MLLQSDEKQEIKDEFYQICDTIQGMYGENAIVEELKQQKES